MAYEAEVWRHGWARSRDAAIRTVRSVAGAVLSAAAGVVIVGTAVELQTLVPIGVAVFVLFVGLLINVGLAPMRLHAQAAKEIEELHEKLNTVQAALGAKQVLRDQYEELKPLLYRGEELLLRGGAPDWISWENLVTNWRQRVYEALPVERDGFYTKATPAAFKAARSGEMKLSLLAAQVDKFRRIMMRLENEKDGWDPSGR